MVSENVWRTKKSKLEQYNTNAADENYNHGSLNTNLFFASVSFKLS